jgi:hypothetical protein
MVGTGCLRECLAFLYGIDRLPIALEGDEEAALRIAGRQPVPILGPPRDEYTGIYMTPDGPRYIAQGPAGRLNVRMPCQAGKGAQKGSCGARGLK